MTARIELVALVFALGAFTACDMIDSPRKKAGIESREYQTAMNDYRAGRIDQAVEGFKKTISLEPGNANARFQLACLLHDTGRDYVTAYWNYLEYISQCPDSDKTKLAKDRLAKCEVELSKALAGKHGLLDGNETILKEIEELKAKLKNSEAKVAGLESALVGEKGRVENLKKENERIMTAVKNVGAGESTAAVVNKKEIIEAKDLLDSEDTEAGGSARGLSAAGKLLAGESAGDGDRIKNSSDIALLRSEEKAERELASSLLPTQPKDAKAARDAAEKAEKERKEKAKLEASKKPEYYIVQEGDTLYKIALKFYGRTSAWRRIREANKTVISMDGRVNEGQKIKLP